MGVLRIILAICVLFGHSAPVGNFNWVSATTAVEMFFVISGFYMQMVLREKYTPERLGKNYKRKFYISRYSRLYPAYVACLLMTVLAAVVYHFIVGKAAPIIAEWTTLFGLPSAINNVILWFWAIISNALIFFQDFALLIGVNDGIAHFTWDRNASDIYVASSLAIPQAWSLGVELLFYIAAPFIFKLRNAQLLWLFLAAFSLKFLVVFFGRLGDLPYRVFPFVLVEFLGGALAYRYRERLIFWRPTNSRRAFFIAYGAVAVLAFSIPKTDGAMAILMVALTMLFTPTIFNATKNWAVDMGIGDLSYPFYIFHFLIYQSLVVLLKIMGSSTDRPSVFLVCTTLGLTVAISWLFKVFEDRYIEPWRRQFGSG